MAQPIRIGILGAGWPGTKHAEGYRAVSGFEVVAVADLIPARRKSILQIFPKAAEFADADSLLAQAQVDAVSVCLPNDLHFPVTIAALKSRTHVLCETPPAIGAGEARKMEAAAEKSGSVLLYAAQRRFGGAEQAAAQAISKGYAGEVYHARASWMRTRGIPAGTGGWFTERARSGGGALIDLGAQMLDLTWRLLGKPTPLTVFAVGHSQFKPESGGAAPFDVEDAAFALLKFEGGKSMELAVSWALNQPPRRHGTACRIHGREGALDVYTPHGPVLYRGFNAKGEAKESPLKLPKVVQYPAMMRHFRECISGGATPSPSGSEGHVVMQMIDALYKSIQSGKSVAV